MVFTGTMMSFSDAITQSSQGVVLCLHVTTGSSQTVFPEKYDHWRKAFEIKVQSKAKDNKANIEVLETLACFFQLSPKDVILISGLKSRQKTVCLKNISVEKVHEKLKGFFHG